MNKEELERGLKLKEAAHAWWRKTIPSFEHPSYQDEPIPQFMKWFNEHAAPELVKTVAFHEAGKEASKELEIAQARKIVNEIALDEHRDKARPHTKRK